MQYSRCTDYELLSRLIGRRGANSLYRGALRPLFAESAEKNPASQKLAIAWELMQRLITEELHSAPVFDSPTAVRSYLQLFYAGRGYESFMVLFLDSTYRLIVAEELFRGTLTQTSVYPREIVKRCLQWNAAAVMLAHNHPSGAAEPSRADEFLTQTIKQALALVDVRVLDHLVVGVAHTTSFAERGLM